MKSQKLKSYIIQEDKKEKENNKERETFRLDEKRCLTIKEFQSYLSIGRNNALKLVKMSGAAIHVGKKILVDRVIFDKWLDEQKSSNTESEFVLL